MTPRQLDTALAAANPITDQAAAALELRGAELELIEQIITIPVRSRPSRTRARRTPRRRHLGLLVAATAAVAAVLALLPSGQHIDGGGPAPAFAASLVRFANASPLALLQLPGWHVVYADEQPGGFGELDFVRGPADAQGNPQGASYRNEASLKGRVASLTWQPANRAARKQVASGHQTAQTGLGVTARQFVQEGRGHGWLDISAFFIDHGRLLRFRATVTNSATFYAELRALQAVDTTTWLRAMPPGVVKSADSGQAIRLMLKGIPLPPGFDAAKIRGAHLVHDRYQLGAAVTGTIACMWIADWNHARKTGDTQTVKRAIAAMATAPHWPILRLIAHQGGWTQVLIGYAKAMPSGTWYGRPLMPDVNSGLGCSA
ncbi:MAG: hypothetical protein ACRDK8_07795, partial [Solirubrobacteraceae bacterium]